MIPNLSIVCWVSARISNIPVHVEEGGALGCGKRFSDRGFTANLECGRMVLLSDRFFNGRIALVPQSIGKVGGFGLSVFTGKSG